MLRKPEAMQGESSRLRLQGRRLGFVPTMGALHDGHLSLLPVARAGCDRIVVSIFVNPTQFGPREDLERYPRDLEGDLRQLERAGCDLVFTPEAADMYAAEARTHVEVRELDGVLCGASRPGHFRGVATVVAKLFHLVQPHVAVFGQKDAQQAILLRRMVRDLNFDVVLRIGPIVRDPDGLALSSRNRYLSAAERRDLLEVIEDRHCLSSTIVATQLPIENWHDNIRDPTMADAILDRLVHNAHKINLKGESMRKLRAKAPETREKKNDTETTDSNS